MPFTHVVGKTTIGLRNCLSLLPKKELHTTAKKLKQALCSTVEGDNYNPKFETQMVRTDEDSMFYKRELEKRLEKDDCSLAEDAKSALLMCQIMRSLLSLIRGKLYDHLLGLKGELATRQKAPKNKWPFRSSYMPQQPSNKNVHD